MHVGLGSAVCELIAERAGERIPVRRLGVRHVFGESGEADQLLELHGLTAPHIARAAEELVKMTVLSPHVHELKRYQIVVRMAGQ